MLKTKLKLAYYPGCSLHGTAKEYDSSTRAVCKALGIELEEVPDWNCCGATSAHSLDRELSFLLPARNLKAIQKQNLDVIIPCAACFSRTKICMDELQSDETLRLRVEEELNFKFHPRTKIYHLLELIVEDIGLEAVKQRIKRSLPGLEVACYYGCLLVRPHRVMQFDDKENPQLLDELMRAIGVKSIDWPYKVECCGASLSLSKARLVTKMVSKMIGWAKEAGIGAIVTACPLCQANMEMRQTRGQNLPIFYFTELLGLAFGLKEIESTLKKHLINTDKIINNLTKKVQP